MRERERERESERERERQREREPSAHSDLEQISLDADQETVTHKSEGPGVVGEGQVALSNRGHTHTVTHQPSNNYYSISSDCTSQYHSL